MTSRAAIPRWIGIYIVILTLLYSGSLCATTKDTIKRSSIDKILLAGKAPVDTLETSGRNNAQLNEMYDSLEIKSKKNFITRNIYKYLVRSNRGGLIPPALKEENTEDKYRPFSGKRVASITIKQVGVFGKDEKGEEHSKDHNKLEVISSKLHIKTLKRVIKSALFFNLGDSVSPLQMAENEKYIRDLSYIRDVNIHIEPLSFDPNRVSVTVTVQDKFPYGASISATPTKGYINLYNTNTLGLGDRSSISYLYKKESEKTHGFSASYKTNNLFGDFESIGISYSNNYKEQVLSLFNITPYRSTTPQFAGGADFKRGFRYSELSDFYPVRLDTTINILAISGWVGKSFKSSKNSSSTSNISLNGKYSFLKLYERPHTTQDSNRVFHGKHLFLGSLSLYKQSLFRGYNIYSYGTTEDIPHGYYMELGGGFEKGEFYNRYYGSLRAKYGIVFPSKNYLYSDLSIGGYYNPTKGDMEQVAINCNLSYFSHIFKIRQFRIRHFANIRYSKGINRFPEEILTLNSDNLLRGFKSDELDGKERISASWEQVNYHKRTLWGFKCASYIFADVSLLGEDHISFKRENIYSGLGIGVRVRNEALVFDTFELRLTFYPNTPSDQNSFEANVVGRPINDFPNFLGREPNLIEYY